MIRFPLRTVQKIELDPATACRFRRDTGFDMRHEGRALARRGSKLKNFKVETSSDPYVNVTHRILT